MPHAAVGHLVAHELAGVLQRECLDVHDLGDEAGGFHRGAALVDVLGARRHEQHVEHVRIGLRFAHDLEVVADFLHGERDVLVGLDLHLSLELVRRRAPSGSWMTLVMAASPLMPMATSRVLVAARFTARRIASPTAAASTMVFSLMEFGGVGSAA